jgi:hypothetical protein
VFVKWSEVNWSEVKWSEVTPMTVKESQLIVYWQYWGRNIAKGRTRGPSQR